MEASMDEDYEIPFERGCDPQADAWFANLLFWRPSQLSDERMRLHFSAWDGVWSEQTQGALRRYDAKGLDLNENWALTPPLWFCPACGRKKDQIFRLSKRGVLLAKLELHHDHLRDYILRRVNALLGTGWRDTVSQGSIVLMDYIRELTSRFDVCLLCSECNAAEGKVKAKLREEIAPEFTFSAQEIGTFVHARPGQDHVLNADQARRLWDTEKENFDAGLALVDQLLTQLSKGQLSRDRRGLASTRSLISAFAPESMLMKAFDEEARDTERAELLWRHREEFLARSTQRDSATLSPVVSAVKPLVGPTEEEYASYVDPVSPKPWRKLDDSWQCPVCTRAKREILRKSKSRKWTGGVRSQLECSLELDPRAMANRRRLFPAFPNGIFVKRTERTLICSDCAGIGMALGQRDQSIREPHLSIEDRRACIVRSQSHAPHEIDYEIAAQRAVANESYAAALSAHFALSNRVRGFSGRLQRARALGIADAKMFEEFAEHLAIFHGIDDPTEQRDLVIWLLQQDAPTEIGAAEDEGEYDRA
jgi:rubredoxin